MPLLYAIKTYSAPNLNSCSYPVARPDGRPMVYSNLSVHSPGNGTPRPASADGDDSVSSHVRHQTFILKESCADTPFKGIMKCSESIDLYFSQFPADFGVESLFRWCTDAGEERTQAPRPSSESGAMFKEELIAMIQDMDLKGNSRKQPMQSCIIDLFNEQLRQHLAPAAPACLVLNSVTFSQVCNIVKKMQIQETLDPTQEQLENLPTTFRNHIGVGCFNVSNYRVAMFLSSFPSRPQDAQQELDKGMMFQPVLRQQRGQCDLTLWTFLKQLCMPPHVFPTAKALGIKSVADLVSYVAANKKKVVAHICCHFCISKLLAERLVDMCGDRDINHCLSRSFCLLPRHFVYQEFIAFYRGCEQCNVPLHEVEITAYRVSVDVSDSRGVSKLSLFEVHDVLQLHRMYPGAAVDDLRRRVDTADPGCFSSSPLSLSKILERVGLEMYAPIFEEMDMQTLAQLKTLDVDSLTKMCPELGLDWDACDRLKKLISLDEDFVFNQFASLDFETCMQSLLLHYPRPATQLTSKFLGTTNAALAFSLFLCRGNFSQFQLATFLSMHPGREAWVSKSRPSSSSFEFAEASSNTVKLPNFFSPEPVVDRIELSLQSVAKRLALPKRSSEDGSLKEFFDKESLKLTQSMFGGTKQGAVPNEQASGSDVLLKLVQKRFALQPRRCVYDYVMKVRN